MKKVLEIVIATGNPHKYQEFSELFEGLPIKLYNLHDLHFTEEIEETALSFKDNSLLKAIEVRKHTDKIVLSDDSGLSVDALDGFPGIYSSRFMANATYAEKCHAIIDRLVPFKNKKASFTCVITLLGLSPEPQVFTGKVTGRIINELRGENGFGYDPVFYYPKAKKTFAEFTTKEKNTYSHRAIAVAKVIEVLKNHF